MEAIILDDNFNAIKIVDAFDTFIWTERYSGYGDFELDIPIEKDILTYIKDGYYVVIPESNAAMIIEDIQINDETDDEPLLQVTGRSLESILDRRIVWDQTEVKDTFQDIILKILNDSIINPTDSNRKIENFTFKSINDSNVNSDEYDTQFTGDNVYDVVQVLCNATSVGFRVYLTDDNKFEFSLYNGVDRSYSQDTNPYVVFSPEFDNLLKSSYLESSKNLKTVTKVAGEGQGTERITVTVESSNGAGSGLNRRELFTDAKDITQTSSDENGHQKTLDLETEYKPLLRERGTEKLSECVTVKAFDGSIEPNTTFILGKDYLLGDIVQIKDRYGIEAKARITEIIRSQKGTKIEVYPTLQLIY